MDHLLVSRCRRLRPPPGVVDQHLNRRTVDNVEADNLAAAVAAYLEGGCIEYQDVLERLAQPSRDGLLAVRHAPELGQPLDACWGVGLRMTVVARFDRPLELLDLVLACLDRKPGNVMAFSQSPQFRETDRLVRARCISRIVADWEIRNRTGSRSGGTSG